ncbi:MAG: calcium-translocating P-type ATPase, SERCA-type [bacterium]
MQKTSEHSWHQIKIDETLSILETTPDGLNAEEVLHRRSLHGPNQIKITRKISPLFIFLKQFKDFLIIILLLATIVSLMIGETLDGMVILGIVLLCALLGFIQEFRSEKAVEALKKMASPTARVIRGGEEHMIPAEEIVPGDIISLQAGDLVPADARISEASNLTMDESVLTGESTPVSKNTDPLSKSDTPLGDRKNILFASTIVNRGRGKGVVVATAMHTEFGKIAGMLQEVKSEKTPLEEQMGVIGKWLGIICVAVCMIALLLGVMRGYPLLEMFIWGVSLAVAAVPEALPAVVTSALAIGVQKMARQKAIVKRLAAVETLGCTTIICTDKTGTLTKNEMTIQEIWADNNHFRISGVGYRPDGGIMKDGRPVDPESYPVLKRLLGLGVLCNDAILQERGGEWALIGDPTEGALIVAGVKGRVDYEGLRRELPRVGEIPFEESRKMMSTIHARENGKRLVATKGAPESIVQRCSHIQKGDRVIPINDSARDKILSEGEAMAKKALRVLALAWREMPEADDEAFDSEGIERGLTFCGLVGMIDPPRDEVMASVKDCLAAGIKPVMVTGDHRMTAQAIARDVGILNPISDQGDSDQVLLSGEDLEHMTDQDIDHIIPKVRVFSRVSPEHKLRIVEAYQRMGEVVAMTGDGVNDAPALKKADIGVAMGIKGTDVSREAADMVLADDNFSTIVAAVKEGRAAFQNIKKYLVFLLSCNVGEILILTGAFFFGLPIPLIALQILWVNLTTDGLPALALGIDPPDPDIMDHPPRGKDSSVFTSWIVTLILIISLHIFLVLFVVFYVYLHKTTLAYAQTMVFLTMILLEMFNSFNCRSHRFSIKERKPWQNVWLVGAVSVSVAMSIMVIHVPLLGRLFYTQPLGLIDWFWAILASSTILLVVEAAKWFRQRYAS